MTIFFLCSCTSASEMTPQDSFPITTFTEEELAKGEPIGWKTHKGICRKIRNKTTPRLIQSEGKNMLYINANDSGSITFKPVHLSPKEYPFLSWKWKVSNILPDSREKEVGGDDYPAVVCIVYNKPFFPLLFGRYKILVYVYGNNLSVGERFKNPCEDRARMITVQSGEKGVGKWLSYKMNHYEDYIQEFGHEPPGIVYVGLQTNADRTHGKVEAWYSDITLNRF
ncbi:MAG: hypothetical protein SCARUB_02497 [Candidatus Scalindua rubra]|uniref:DUF3047 domain-containing protein n=1 Tax=Candidatus Scalindua rubra TaxID=1872076 RepID=A0A1E3X9S4_9BACT|nr:MAG: hypothetical protein SCARUB_02497 [Candidatus Scalindua rubra]